MTLKITEVEVKHHLLAFKTRVVRGLYYPTPIKGYKKTDRKLTCFFDVPSRFFDVPSLLYIKTSRNAKRHAFWKYINVNNCHKIP